MIFSKIINKNKALIVQIFYNLKNHPSFHSEERLVNGQLISKRKRVLCWSINNISLWDTGALSTCSNLQSSHILSSIQLLPVGWDSFSCLTTATSVRDKFCFKSCLNKAACLACCLSQHFANSDPIQPRHKNNLILYSSKNVQILKIEDSKI